MPWKLTQGAKAIFSDEIVILLMLVIHNFIHGNAFLER